MYNIYYIVNQNYSLSKGQQIAFKDLMIMKFNTLFIIVMFVLSISGCSSQEKETGTIKSGDQILFSPGDDNVREYRIPSLITTHKGTLIAACDARVKRKGDLPNNIDIAIRRSEDNGETWEAIKYAIKSGATEGSCDPSIIVDKETGTIWMFVLHGNEGVGLWQSKAGIDESTTGHIYVIKSDDDGLTWSEPLNINSMVKNPEWLCALAAPGRGFQMKNGTLVIPGYFRSEKEPNLLCSYIFYSKDHGETWSYSTTPAENTTECTVVELADGRLMLNMRNHYNKGMRAISYTSDLGTNWTPLRFDEELIDPVCQANMIEYDYNDEKLLLFANSASSKGRKNQSIKISYDEGDTWPIQKTIFKGRSAYSCLTQLHDGSIGLLYEKGNRGAIAFKRVTLNWLKSDVQQRNIVVFGNSTTAFRPMTIDKVYGLRLEEKLNKAGISSNVINSGIGGSHTGSVEDNNRFKIKHALDRFQIDVLEYNPDVVVMQFGINDSYVDEGGVEAHSRIPLEKYYENMTYMVKEMQKNSIKVVLMTPNPFDESKEQWRYDRLSLYMQKLKQVAKENNTELVDVWAMFEAYKKENETMKPLLLDGVHPNDIAHELIANELSQIVYELLK